MRLLIASAVLWVIVAATKPDTPPTGTDAPVQGTAGPAKTVGPETPAGESSYVPLVDAEAPYVELFIDCGQQHGIDPALLAGVAAVESTFRPDPVSPKGAQGLMQFMPNTASAMGVDPWDPASAICGTARYLATSYGIHGNWPETIAAYNAGDGAVGRRGVAAADGTYVEDVQTQWTARIRNKGVVR